MSQAYVFPGQGSQYSGMGKSLCHHYPAANEYFSRAGDLLGFDIQKIMFSGSDDELKQTQVTQPAVFIHSVAAAFVSENFSPNMVAGHSLGEFSALVANDVLSFDDGLILVSKRARAMQKACESRESTMAAVLGLEDRVIEEICENATGIVVAANYNCPGQVVISGEIKAVKKACSQLIDSGAKRALMLPVGGAFHSPLMEPAREELAEAIENTVFNEPKCPVYQNVDPNKCVDVVTIKKNLVLQLTSPVRWTQSVQNMIKDGADQFVECGPGKVLQGLIRKIDGKIEVSHLS